jgi:hypothetical protein
MSENEKTFTQEEVNNIVSKRIKEERDKLEKEYAAKDLEKEARAALEKAGFSPDLVSALNMTDRDTVMKNIELMSQGKAQQDETAPGVNYQPNGGMKPPDSEADKIRRAMGLT